MPNTSESFNEKSYQSHSGHFEQYKKGGNRASLARTWLDQNTVDSWRHNRHYKALDPILISAKDSNWLTVGDGRFGRDARYILDQGVKALATDISDSLLKEARNDGYIKYYKKENAERLSFEDMEFDYTLCKESYHHFPRPMIALYEMLRVSKKGILLIEPNDDFISDSLLTGLSRNIKIVIKRLLGKIADKHSFEETGNFVYRISQREMEKVALGLNYRYLAIKGINDIYLEGAEYEHISENGPLLKKIKTMIRIADFLCNLRLMTYTLLAIYIFREQPSNQILQELDKSGFKVIELPGNPYIS